MIPIVHLQHQVNLVTDSFSFPKIMPLINFSDFFQTTGISSLLSSEINDVKILYILNYLKTNTMKKLLLVLLFVPLVSFGQSQMLNGIEINAPLGFKKTGNLIWEKGDDIVEYNLEDCFPLFSFICIE